MNVREHGDVARVYESADDWRSDLQSPDEATVVSALHAACPCEGDRARDRYEEFMHLVSTFKKDRRPKVRAVALHLERDALEELAKEDERSVGWTRNRPGGNSRRSDRRPRRSFR